jgi:hypothetical protein
MEVDSIMNSEETVEVRFVTKLTDIKYHMTDKPFRVPIQISRRGLSGIVNHVLGLGCISKVYF